MKRFTLWSECMLNPYFRSQVYSAITFLVLIVLLLAFLFLSSCSSPVGTEVAPTSEEVPPIESPVQVFLPLSEAWPIAAASDNPAYCLVFLLGPDASYVSGKVLPNLQTPRDLVRYGLNYLDPKIENRYLSLGMVLPISSMTYDQVVALYSVH